jgi:hypothetical protein
MRLASALCMLLALCAAAPAGVVIDLVSVANTDVPSGDAQDPAFFGGLSHFTFDLRVTITGVDDWKRTMVEIDTYAGVTIYQHPNQRTMPLQAPPISPTGSLKYDSFYRSPGNPNGDPTYISGPVSSATMSDAEWTDSASLGAGDFTIARWTFVLPAETEPPVINGPGELLVRGFTDTETAGTLGEIFDFTINTPEPSSVFLLLAGMALSRCRTPA